MAYIVKMAIAKKGYGIIIGKKFLYVGQTM